jgi:hypothetical protein
MLKPGPHIRSLHLGSDDYVEKSAQEYGYSSKRMYSGPVMTLNM